MGNKLNVRDDYDRIISIDPSSSSSGVVLFQRDEESAKWGVRETTAVQKPNGVKGFDATKYMIEELEKILDKFLSQPGRKLLVLNTGYMSGVGIDSSYEVYKNVEYAIKRFQILNKDEIDLIQVLDSSWWGTLAALEGVPVASGRAKKKAVSIKFASEKLGKTIMTDDEADAICATFFLLQGKISEQTVISRQEKLRQEAELKLAADLKKATNKATKYAKEVDAIAKEMEEIKLRPTQGKTEENMLLNRTFKLQIAEHNLETATSTLAKMKATNKVAETKGE